MDLEARGRALELVARRPQLRDELLERAHSGKLPGLEKVGLSPSHLERFFEGAAIEPEEVPAPEGAPELAGLDFDQRLEAVVRDFGRPTILVVNDTWEAPDADAEMSVELEAARPKIERVLSRVGRVEFRNVPLLWGGTGWVVDERIVVTNRHVAEIVAQADGRGGFRFKPTPAGVPAEARVDFKAELGALDDTSEEVPLSAIRYLASASQPDIALFEVAKSVRVPRPVSLSTKRLAQDTTVAVIGYPAFDSRSPREPVEHYFGDIFDVKRLAPGLISQAPAADNVFFMHDATTLGGNSGSLVLDLASGRAVGLHFAGQFHVGNFAHTVSQIKKALRGLKVMVTVPEELVSLREKRDGSHPRNHFRGRTGYDPAFLGTGARRVPLPTLGPHEADVAVATEPGGAQRPELRYTHFSVKLSTSRRVPRLTACNIDGSKYRKVKRGDDQWFTDGRVPAEVQLGEADYAHPEIDRGHMVRREDPNWGTPAEVRRANDDTFHYTNAAPQHELLNQSKTEWLGLETYVLENAKTHGLKISVFTGPILRDTDPRLDNGVQVPEEFWKIIVALDDQRRLRATGYVLSQGSFIEDITEGFAFGAYRTYQVEISKIAAATGYQLDQLGAVDALAGRGLESPMPDAPIVVPLDRLEQMVL